MRFEYFQMIDRVVALDVEGRVVRCHSVVPQQSTVFEGRFPTYPLMPGALLIGDAGGTLNFPKIKGIHQAIRSGTLAAQHIAERDTSAGFDARWRASIGG